jgi:hypothetical protein
VIARVASNLTKKREEISHLKQDGILFIQQLTAQ